MGLEELDFGELPSSIEEAFPAFVRIVTDDYKKQYKNDRSVIPPSGMPDSRWGFPSGPISDSMW